MGGDAVLGLQRPCLCCPESRGWFVGRAGSGSSENTVYTRSPAENGDYIIDEEEGPVSANGHEEGGESESEDSDGSSSSSSPRVEGHATLDSLLSGASCEDSPWFPHRWRSWRSLARGGARAAQRARQGCGPLPQRLPDGVYVTAKYWGITKPQLRSLYRVSRRDEDWSDSDSVADFVRKFVKPRTQGSGTGLALALNRRQPREVNLMISHAWTENCRDFFEDVLANTYEHEVAFICFLSNYQGTPNEIDEQLGPDIHRSPFTEVISNPACQRMLVIPNEALSSSGEGLYSRLWCDWEIKVAADAGLPIHIWTRNTEEHLLGRRGRSSRHARCGEPALPINKDERLIRHAIETLPPETARSTAVGVALVFTCMAYGPPLSYRLFPCIQAWLSGLFGGLFLGLALTWLVSRCMRPRSRDGYKVLDEVIRGAPRGLYFYRRFRARTDLPEFILFAVFCGLLDLAVRRLLEGGSWCHLLLYFVEGGGAGVLLWPLLDTNKMGAWTGVFVTAPWERRGTAAFLLLAMLAFGVVDAAVLNQISTLGESIGRGACHGWMAGLVVISAFYRRWKHAAGLFMSFVVLGLIRFCQSGLWREIFITLMGFGAVVVRSDWLVGTRLALFTLEVLALVGLFALARFDHEAQQRSSLGLLHERNYLQSCDCRHVSL